jgi:hypothetical protein
MSSRYPTNLLESSLKNIPKDKNLAPSPPGGVGVSPFGEAPIIYNDIIRAEIKHCDYILDSLPVNNKVKIYLIKNL